jgi:hypothetical protein
MRNRENEIKTLCADLDFGWIWCFHHKDPGASILRVRSRIGALRKRDAHLPFPSSFSLLLGAYYALSSVLRSQPSPDADHFPRVFFGFVLEILRRFFSGVFHFARRILEFAFGGGHRTPSLLSVSPVHSPTWRSTRPPTSFILPSTRSLFMVPSLGFDLAFVAAILIRSLRFVPAMRRPSRPESIAPGFGLG